MCQFQSIVVVILVCASKLSLQEDSVVVFDLMKNQTETEIIYDNRANITSLERVHKEYPAKDNKQSHQQNNLNVVDVDDLTELDKDLRLNNGCQEGNVGVLCSGNGECVNNKCICKSMTIIDDNTTISYAYSGKYCEECPYCRAQRCRKFLPCVECNLLRHRGPNCYDVCQFSYTIVEETWRNVENDEKICEIEARDSCFVKFKYFYTTNDNLPIVEMERNVNCFNGMKLLLFVFWGVVLYIFALATLVLKCCWIPEDRPPVSSRLSLNSGIHHCDIIRTNL